MNPAAGYANTAVDLRGLESVDSCKFDILITCHNKTQCGANCQFHIWHREYLQGRAMGYFGHAARIVPTTLKEPRKRQNELTPPPGRCADTGS